MAVLSGDFFFEAIQTATPHRQRVMFLRSLRGVQHEGKSKVSHMFKGSAVKKGSPSLSNLYTPVRFSALQQLNWKKKKEIFSRWDVGELQVKQRRTKNV